MSVIRRTKKNNEVAPMVMLTSMIDMFTILLVFLLKSYTAVDINPSEKLQLPLSLAEKLPELALKVTISKESLTLDGREIVPVDNGRIHRAFINNLLIQPLYDALKQHVDRREALLKDHPDVAKRLKEKILIIADKQTPASLLDQVFYTISQREFGKFHLVVYKKARNHSPPSEEDGQTS